MPGLNTALDIAAPDDFYQALIDAHRGLSDEQSQALNARLILLLANHIGDLEVLREALAARETGCERVAKLTEQCCGPRTAAGRNATAARVLCSASFAFTPSTKIDRPSVNDWMDGQNPSGARTGMSGPYQRILFDVGDRRGDAHAQSPRSAQQLQRSDAGGCARRWSTTSRRSTRPRRRALTRSSISSATSSASLAAPATTAKG